MENKIKWISEEVDSHKVQNLLNMYNSYIIPESLIITHSADNCVLVTFYLSQTFNSLEELNMALKKEPLF
jgi:hypothetical protein